MAKKTPPTSEIRRDVLIPLSELSAHPRNYRKHPKRQIERIRASLRRFGQVKSIVVQEGQPGAYLIVAGHGVTEAAREEGYEALYCNVIPANWTPEQVEGYLIADNMGGADDDQLLLVEMLSEQQAAGAELESMGYSDEELQDLIASLEEKQEPMPDEGDAESETVPQIWGVVIECSNEAEQVALLERFAEEGLACRALIN